MGTSLLEYFNEQQIQGHVAKVNTEMKQQSEMCLRWKSIG